MKKTLALIILFLTIYSTKAQSLERHKIAIFTPLYLDSAFDETGNYKLDKTFPKIFNPGADFYLGAQLALDSLQKRVAPIDVYIYDTKSKEPLFQQLNRIELKDMEMIIAQANVPETKVIADIALRRKIPFISATLPNDAGITNNPYLVILNSTLQSHIEGIYRFLQRYYSLDKIIVFRKKGLQEDQIKNYFTEFSKATASVPLNIKFVDLGSNFSAENLLLNLDSTKRNICISGTLDELFGMHLAHELATLNKKYPLTLFGMPTWENLNFSKGELNNLDIIYSTPFYYNHTLPLENQIILDYTNKVNNKPSDIYLRGYETTLRFALLLLDTKKDIASNLVRKGNTIFTQFDIQPVFKDKKTMTLDYFENKHLYFVKVLGGVKNILY